MDETPWPETRLPTEKAAARTAAREHAREAVARNPAPLPEESVRNMLGNIRPRPGTRWGIYWPLPSEAPLGYLLSEDWREMMALARTQEDHSLVFIAWDGVAPFTKDALNMDAPPLSCGVVPDEKLAVLMVPGLAFGPKGERLGRGKGCYDKTLKRVGGALRIAVTWDHCLFAFVPTHETDEPVDLIVTQTRFHWTGARGRMNPGPAVQGRGPRPTS